jgi:hypothetical protein
MHSQKHCRLGNIYERFEFAVAFDLLHLLLLAGTQCAMRRFGIW